LNALPQLLLTALAIGVKLNATTNRKVMKNRISAKQLTSMAAIPMLALFTRVAVAQNSNTATPQAPEAAASSKTAPAQLSYGVPDVLKLTKAQVSEDTVVSFVRNSGTSYNLSVSEIIYLRKEGVSDHVLTAMLEQHQRLTDVAARTTPQPTPTEGNAQPAQVVTQPATTYVTSAPSTVYVARSSPPIYYPYYDYYPYYGGYYYPYYPALSFSFGFGNYYHHGGYHHGGGYHGGGSHGGGSHWGGSTAGGIRAGGSAMGGFRGGGTFAGHHR
jgi:hypothetical protein